ncbi:MAG: sensor histidine kinase [Candidatus Coproplasma sp.]
MEFFTFVYDYVFIIQLATVCIALLAVFYPFRKTVKSFAYAGVHFLALFCAGTLINWGLFVLSGSLHFLAGINFQLSWLILICAYLCLSRIYLASRLIMGATLYVSVIAVCDLGRQVMNLMPPGGGWINIVFYVLIIAYSVLLRHYTLKYYSDIPIISVILIMINAVCSVLLIFAKTVISVNSGQGTTQDIFYTLTLAVIYVFSVSGYMMIYFHCKVRKSMTELQVSNRLLESDKQMLIISEQAISELRSMRHDIKNQYKVMEIMLSEGKYEELGKYFASMNESFLAEACNGFVDCGNTLINSIINMELLKANKYGVQLDTKINVPDQLPFEQSDLCRILVNLIDNALEAVLRMDNKDYFVSCRIGCRADYLYICVLNKIKEDCDRDVLLEMNTEKEDAVNHGYGHRIVKRIAEKYNGLVNYTIEENEFMAEVMLEFCDVKTDKTAQESIIWERQ